MDIKVIHRDLVHFVDDHTLNKDFLEEFSKKLANALTIALLQGVDYELTYGKEQSC